MFNSINITNLVWLDEGQTVIGATVDGEVVNVPAMPGNRHYDYIVANSLTIDPYVHVDVVPAELTKYQFVKQLKATNKLTQIKTFILGLAEDHEARLEWDFTERIKIDGPLITAVKTELALTDQQVDTFFINAGAF